MGNGPGEGDLRVTTRSSARPLLLRSIGAFRSWTRPNHPVQSAACSLSTISTNTSLSGEVWQFPMAFGQQRLHLPSSGVNFMPYHDRSRGFTLTKADQLTLIGVTIGILIVTGLLVSLLF
jgi:hypothetical protein